MRNRPFFLSTAELFPETGNHECSLLLRTADIVALEGDDPLLSRLDHLECRLRFRRVAGHWDCEGQIAADFTGECVRCLETKTRRFVRDFRARFVPVEEREREEERRMREAGELFVYPSEAGGADLRELLHEQVSFALPSYFVCDEDCQGLRAYCDDENEARAAADSPFARLLNLDFSGRDES